MPSVNDRSLRATGTAYDAALVTPNDNADLAKPCRAFTVATAGDVKVTTLAGTTLTIPGVSGRYDLGVTRIHSTGTTALGIVALY